MWHYSPELKTILEEISRHTLFGEEYVRVRHPQTGQTYRLPSACLGPVDALVPPSADAVMARAIAARITEALKGDVMLSPLEADIIPLPHQLYALHRAMGSSPLLSSPPNWGGCRGVRFLLADEVGLGKTIEAGLILRELKLRGLVERVLVLAPKSLLLQWVSEMETHFGETFTLVQPSGIEGDLWKEYPQVVVSIDAVKPMEKRHGWTPAQVDAYNRKRFNALVDAGWDVVIIDEAHKVAGAYENVARHQMARGLADTVPHLLLLAATPHSGKTEAFHRLMSLLDADAFPSPEFVSRDRIQPYIIRTEKQRAVDASGRPLFKPRHTRLVPVEWTGDDVNQKRLYDAVTAYVIEGYNRAQQEQQTAVGFLMVLMQRLVTSSTRAIRTTLERRLQVLEVDVARHSERRDEESQAEILSEPQDDKTDDSAFFDEELLELDAQEQLEQLIRIRLKGLEEERREVQFLLDLSRRAEAEGVDAKAKALLFWLTTFRREEANANLKFLVFTEFVPTQEMLCEFLQRHGYSTVRLNGSMSLEGRREAQAAFRESAQVLVSTEAGGEGLNLQFCHIVINYDLPWNPMRLEQRIGRVDRIGQSHDVHALNFVLADSVEYRVQEVLEEKLKTILTEFGVDKTSDILDSTGAEADFTRFHIHALLDPSRIESEAEALAASLRADASQESRNLIIDDTERDVSHALMLEGHPMPFWVEKLVTHAVRAEGGSAEKALTGWHLRWGDGTEMKAVNFHRDGIGSERLTLEHPRIRTLLTASAVVAPGMSIPRFQAAGLPSTLKGIWALWELRITPAFEPNPPHFLTDPMRRVFPVFVNERGRPLWSSARSIWEWFLRDYLVLHPLPQSLLQVEGGKGEGIDFDVIASAAETQAQPLFEAMKAAYRAHIESERSRANFSFEARRKLLSHIGLENVRRYRERELTRAHEARMQTLERRTHISPELTPLLIIEIAGAHNGR